MGSYFFERNIEGGAGRDASESLSADVERALREFDWVENLSVQADDGDGSVVVADVHFDPDWPDTANPDLVAETLQRYGLAIIEDHKGGAGRVSATDPLRVGAAVGDDALDLIVFDE